MGSLLGKKNITSMALAWKMLLWLLVAQVMVSLVGRSLAPLSILIGADAAITAAIYFVYFPLLRCESYNYAT
ncbi:hypothetical protein ASG99_16725 [Bacillus sp. Soil768D1]|nr:hypothetical protein ASG99_16725 [Bacillus sp. Soil768D1]